MLQSFCTFVNQSGGEYTCPKIGPNMPLALRQCRHPMLEKLGDASVVPNDVSMALSTNFQIVTGPNMAGKSTCVPHPQVYMCSNNLHGNISIASWQVPSSDRSPLPHGARGVPRPSRSCDDATTESDFHGAAIPLLGALAVSWKT